MVITGIVQPLATIPSISKLYFTHSTCFRSIVDNLVDLCRRKSIVGTYGLLNRKPASPIIGLVMNLDGERHPDARRY